MIILRPAYGKNYATSEEVKKAYYSGAEFRLVPSDAFCSKEDFQGLQVKIEFNQFKDSIVLKN